MAERIRCFFDRSGRTYGSPRITLDLWEEGWQVSQNTAAATHPRRSRSCAAAGAWRSRWARRVRAGQCRRGVVPLGPQGRTSTGTPSPPAQKPG
ncbi:IS3 family transposase [Streptomyces caniscabiei]|uniref:IS3 family transposase n=1 Tax=Streptomyces caniscabiei TaxID=2746961 RepID=UPI0038D46670